MAAATIYTKDRGVLEQGFTAKGRPLTNLPKSIQHTLASTGDMLNIYWDSTAGKIQQEYWNGGVWLDGDVTMNDIANYITSGFLDADFMQELYENHPEKVQAMITLGIWYL